MTARRSLVLLFATSLVMTCSQPVPQQHYGPLEYELPIQLHEAHSRRDEPAASERHPERKPEASAAAEPEKLPPCSGAVESGGAIVFTRRGTPCQGEQPP